VCKYGNSKRVIINKDNILCIDNMWEKWFYHLLRKAGFEYLNLPMDLATFADFHTFYNNLLPSKSSKFPTSLDGY